MANVPSDPGSTADSIVPPWPGRLPELLQEVSTELGRLATEQRPELIELKADVDRILAKLRSMTTSA